MAHCAACGKWTPWDDEICDACLAGEWDELRRRANLWDVDQLRATVEDKPKPTRRARVDTT